MFTQAATGRGTIERPGLGLTAPFVKYAKVSQTFAQARQKSRKHRPKHTAPQPWLNTQPFGHGPTHNPSAMAQHTAVVLHWRRRLALILQKGNATCALGRCDSLWDVPAFPSVNSPLGVWAIWLIVVLLHGA